jgi:hypothetical protein
MTCSTFVPNGSCSAFNDLYNQRMKKTKTWIITGASRGFGLEISKAVLASGDKVTATVRSSGGACRQTRSSFEPASCHPGYQ